MIDINEEKTKLIASIIFELNSKKIKHKDLASHANVRANYLSRILNKKAPCTIDQLYSLINVLEKLNGNSL